MDEHLEANRALWNTWARINTPDAPITSVEHVWPHTVSDIINALARAGSLPLMFSLKAIGPA